MFALIFLSKGEICKSIPDYLIYALQEEEMVSMQIETYRRQYLKKNLSITKLKKINTQQIKKGHAYLLT